MRVGPSTVQNPHRPVPPPPPPTPPEASGNQATRPAPVEQAETATPRAQGVVEKLASGHFNDVAAMRLRLNHADAIAESGVELPPPPETSSHPGRGFEKALAAYQAAFSPPPPPEATEETSEPVGLDLDDVLSPPPEVTDPSVEELLPPAPEDAPIDELAPPPPAVTDPSVDGVDQPAAAPVVEPPAA